MPNTELLKSLDPDSAERIQIEAIFKDYDKLQKTLNRLTKHSDRFEEELRKTSKELKDKNLFLEHLTNKLSKYLSPQVFNSIFENKGADTLGTQRKKLTVFFSDIAGFTSTSEQLQPEELTNYLNEYLAEMSIIALKYGATIDKFIGDAVMIFFGDPETLGQDKDALQCVKMAIEMQSRLLELRLRWSEKGFPNPFRVRMGINTGYCNVGNFGFDNRMEYTIIGGEVNLASRLEGLADIDGILISHETYMHVKDAIACEARDPVPVKGLARLVKTYAVKGLKLDQAEGSNPHNDSILEYLGLEIDLDKLTVNQKHELRLRLLRLIDSL